MLCRVTISLFKMLLREWVLYYIIEGKKEQTKKDIRKGERKIESNY